MVNLSSPSNLQLHTAHRQPFKSMSLCTIVSCFRRVEKVAVRHLLTIRANSGHLGRTEREDEGSGLCYFQRD